MKTFYFTKNNLLSSIAKWAVCQSPYPRPENLEIVLDMLDIIIDPLFEHNEFGNILNLSYEDIKKFVFNNITKIPEAEAWNEPKIKSDNPFIGTSSRFHQPKPDYDFIDLHALARNVANDIIREGFQTPIPLILKEREITTD